MKNRIIPIVLGAVILLATGQKSYSQGINLANSSFVKISNGAYLVLNTSSVNGIKETGTGGAIISEGETNRVKWNVGTTTGIYTIPFRNSVGTDIPLTVNKTSAGTEVTSGALILSTYLTASNNIPWATDVTHMTNNGGGDNTLYTMDRFWIIEANDYSVKPDVTLTFGYDPNEILAPNTITEANLQAQRFNSTSNIWGDWGPGGIVNTTTKVVGSVNINNADFFRTWVLVDNTSPLPIELLDFSAECTKSGISIYWATTSQLNNDYFTLEKSDDRTNFYSIALAEGEGSSNYLEEYSYFDKSPAQEITYYRLKQTDFDGHNTYSNLIAIEGCYKATDKISVVYNSDVSVTIGIYAERKHKYMINLYNLSGQKLWASEFDVQKGNNVFVVPRNDLSSGLYLLSLQNGNGVITKKLMFR